MKLSEITLDDVRDLDFNDAGSWPLVIRVIVFVIIASVIGGVGYKFLIANQVKALQVVTAEEKDLRVKLEGKQRKVATLAALKLQVAKLERDFASLRDQLPGKTEVASLLQEVSQSRVITGLEEELFNAACTRIQRISWLMRSVCRWARTCWSIASSASWTCRLTDFSSLSTCLRKTFLSFAH